MGQWTHRVKIKHLFVDEEFPDHASLQKSMIAIAEVLDKSVCFRGFDLSQWRSLPGGDDFFSPVEYADKLLQKMYDFADIKRIWIH